MIENKFKICEWKEKYPEIILPAFSYPAKHPLILDIETTGFSAKKEMIYALGCIYSEQGEFYFHQFFAEQNEEEIRLLTGLETLLQEKEIDLLVHFNGKHFDIPFLITRSEIHHLSSSLSALPQLDYYLEWKHLKSYFQLTNAKLKSLEKLFRFSRKDTMDGGKLIPYYYEYQRGNRELLPFLLLHNEEDLLASFLLGHLLPLLEAKTEAHQLFPYYNNFSMVLKTESEQGTCYYNEAFRNYLFHALNPNFFSEKISALFERDYPAIVAELHYFLSDYRNYYYLPAEDTAIHKSVSQYVDPAFRKQATKQTAYIKKRDCFVAIPDFLIPYFSGEKLFQSSYTDSTRYLPQTLWRDFLQQKESNYFTISPSQSIIPPKS